MMAERVVELVVPDRPSKHTVGVCCFVCGGFIPKDEDIDIRYIGFLPEMCDKCKAAIMAMRKQIEVEDHVHP